MKYAARKADGSYTGAVYDAVTPRETDYHATFGEVLVPVAALVRIGEVWHGTPPSIEDLRATWSVTRFQARQALREADLLASAEAAIMASGDALIIGAWEDALSFHRLSPSIVAMAATLGLTEEQVDDLFRAAVEIEA